MNFNWDDFNWDALGAIGQDWRQSRQQTNQIQLQTLLQQIAEQKAESVRDERREYEKGSGMKEEIMRKICWTIRLS